VQLVQLPSRSGPQTLVNPPKVHLPALQHPPLHRWVGEHAVVQACLMVSQAELL
jgi:hypothetical protein